MDSPSCYRPTATNPAELRRHLAGLKVKNAVIDGEIVCLDEEGRSIADRTKREATHAD